MLLFLISHKGSFIYTFPHDRTAHATAFDGQVVDHWLERKIGHLVQVSVTNSASDDDAGGIDNGGCDGDASLLFNVQ